MDCLLFLEGGGVELGKGLYKSWRNACDGKASQLEIVLSQVILLLTKFQYIFQMFIQQKAFLVNYSEILY